LKHVVYSLFLLFLKSAVLLNCSKHNQGRNEVRRRPGQEASLSLPCSSLRPFGRKFTVLKKVLVKMLGLFGNPAEVWRSPHWFGAPIMIRRPGNYAASCPPSLRRWA